IIGLLTTTIVSLTFGLSTKYWVALSSSARYGTFNARNRKSRVEFGEKARNATPFASAATKGQQTPEPGLLGEGGILSIPKVKTILLLACVVQSLFTGFEEVYPLWALSIVSVGGLGWST
ncbi:unnamed protein product, partial [Ectocarpus sp. 12 AP-2014]